MITLKSRIPPHPAISHLRSLGCVCSSWHEGRSCTWQSGFWTGMGRDVASDRAGSNSHRSCVKEEGVFVPGRLVNGNSSSSTAEAGGGGRWETWNPCLCRGAGRKEQKQEGLEPSANTVTPTTLRAHKQPQLKSGDSLGCHNLRQV